ncbi:MAG: tyrosine-type recombinase/integrase [Lachnospiraceae bacterium]
MSTTQPIKNWDQLQIFKNYYKSVKKNNRNYCLVILGLNSALRISDILHLTYGDVFDYKQKQWKTHIVVKEHKTGKINRIYMNRELTETLMQYADLTAHTAQDYLFTGKTQGDQPLSRSQAYRIIKEAATFAGLSQNVSCHSLRKTFGYHAWKQGAQPVLLMNIFNHSTFQITKRYLGIDQDDKDAVFEHINL